jgi:hypothetical protein
MCFSVHASGGARPEHQRVVGVIESGLVGTDGERTWDKVYHAGLGLRRRRDRLHI